MSLWSRVRNVFAGNRVNREIDEELGSHLDEAIARGRDAEEARRALGSPLLHRERSHDVRVVTWLDDLRADAIFGLRQIRKNAIASAVAILSLALAIGGCTAAFRIIDAILLRPLPVEHPERLFLLPRQGNFPFGRPQTSDGWEYPLFARMRAAVKEDAELIAISYTERTDLSYSPPAASAATASSSSSTPSFVSGDEMENANRQFVSGWMFGTFGLQPRLGRLFTEQDDRTPGAHPYAVLSYDYWTRRFGWDPGVIGRTVHFDDHAAAEHRSELSYEIVGVAPAGFTGTEPGTMTDIFVPAMMHRFVTRSDASWFRTFAYVKPGVALGPLRDRLQAIARVFQEERAKGFRGDMPKARVADFINQTVLIDPAATGASFLQDENRRGLLALGVLVALVLLIACANVASLMTAQASARAREMALRVSIGAGRGRLVQLVLVESAWLASLATAIGVLFAWWAAPFVVRLINPPNNPARLALPADWRVLGFGVALTLVVTGLFGLMPALRASAVAPVSALRGGSDPRAHRRGMYALIAGQVAFCVLVLFVAGLFVATFERLTHLATGFSAERVVTLETVARPGRQAVFWDGVANHLREIPGVERVSISSQPLLSGWASNSFLSINGAPPGNVMAYFLSVSPGWLETMKIPLIGGRDFVASDTAPGAAIVNETFAKVFFNSENPIGRTFENAYGHVRFRIVGLVRDARYRSMREPMLPVAYKPFLSMDANGEFQTPNHAFFIVRTSSTDPLTLAPVLRHEVSRARPEFRVSAIRTQTSLNESHTVRERLLAMLALFFAGVALVVAGVGLYGSLHYSVLQRRREIGIRLAIGAPAGDIARGVTLEMFVIVAVGAAAGLVLGVLSARSIESLFYEVKRTDLAILAWPLIAMGAVAVFAAMPPVIRALRIDPVAMLRAD